MGNETVAFSNYCPIETPKTMVKFPRILLVGKVHFMLRYIRQHYKAKQLTTDIFFYSAKSA